MIEKFVSNFELSKKMKELGFTQKSIWYWYFRGNCKTPEIVLGEASAMLSNVWQRVCSAYLVGELGEILPDKINECKIMYYKNLCSNGVCDYWVYVEKPTGENSGLKIADTEANARARMAIYLKKKGLI